MNIENEYMLYRNTFVWDPVQYQLAKGPNGFDHTKSTILHWLHTPDETATARTLESTKAPLEKRVWYTYPGQAKSIDFGTFNTRTAIGRLRDDGASELAIFQYNAMGKVTQATDAAGRQWTYAYAPNAIDLVAVSNTTGGGSQVVAAATYNAQHEPLTVTGANGKTTTYEYNPAGQLTKRTDAQGNATTYAYDGKGYLTKVDGPLPGATYALTYDPAGRIGTATDPAGRSVAFSYDAADRPTGSTFPDGTTSKLAYNLLDLVSLTDRLGQTTTLGYDARRELVSATDALGKVTTYGHSPAAKLTSLTDPNGHTTTWARDAQERVIGKTYADGTSEIVGYEASTSRVHQITDAAQQTTTYGYALDGSVSSIVRAKAGAVTETISFAYDAAYPRRTTMSDPLGVTTYAYYPVSVLGATRTQSVTSPVAGAPAGTMDTVTYAYDELDRVAGRNVDGVAESVTFDALGRPSNVTNPLDAFTYGYADATPRVSVVTSVHGPTIAFSYNDAKGDGLLREIDATAPDKSPLAQLTYQYNADDNVTSLTQSYLGKALLAGGANGGMIAPLLKKLANEPKSGAKSEDVAAPWRIVVATLAGSAILSLLALLGLQRNQRGLRGAWLAPVMLGALFAGCGHDASAPAPIVNPGTTYLYDAANRVTAAQGEGPAAYAYDPASNLTSITSASTSAGGHKDLTYSSTNSITSGGATYDPTGNPTSLDGVTYTWDAAKRIVSVSNGSTESDFTYDGLSRLVRIVDKNGGAVTADHAFTWSGTERCAVHDNAQAGSPVTKRYFAQGVVDGGQPYYYVRDLLGSVRQLVDATGKVRAQYDYDPYGNPSKVAGDLESDIGYAGYYRHAASGLSFALFRAYDAGHGRWLNRDPIREGGGINLYAYTGGNPVNQIDPSGLRDQSDDIDEMCSWHAERNQFNRCPKKQSSCEGAGLHHDDLKNKWRSDAGDECAYDGNGDLLPDEDGNYSYNFAGGSNPYPWKGGAFWGFVQHLVYDFFPHFTCGGGNGYTPNLTHTY